MDPRWFLLAGLLALGDCAGPVRVIPASLDPSNPQGPEGAVPPLPTPPEAVQAPPDAAPADDQTPATQPSSPAEQSDAPQAAPAGGGHHMHMHTHPKPGAAPGSAP